MGRPAKTAAPGDRVRIRIHSVLVLVGAVLIAACATPPERRGQRLFAGCPDGVDDAATARSGLFVCQGRRDPAPFDGNGRACGDCHVPGDRFGISVQRIATLPPDHPFFFAGIDEDPELLREHGLVHVLAPEGIDEFRQTPKLVHLQRSCDEDGNCDALGLLGDRVPNLCAFSMQAIANHMARTTNRVPGTDFRLPTAQECDWLVAYMLSDLVTGR